jgi:N-acetylglucosaminyl-diphospho-decaprenol L-rhamnosyltransferase
VTPPVGAVIVSYNVRPLLLRCIESLRADGVGRIVVVDNASVDGSAAAAASVDGVEIVALDTNLGFGAGANRGAALLDEPYLLVVNPDVVVDPGSTKLLVDVLDSSADIGLVAPRIETPDGRLYESVRRFPTLADAVGHAFLHFLWPTNRFSRRYKMLDWDHAAACDVDWVAGTYLLVRRSAWLDVGGFDERYFMYMEDVDLSRRLGIAGWRRRYEPDARIVHEIGRSTDQTPYRMITAHHLSLYRYVDEIWQGPRRVLLPFVAAALTVRTGLAWAQRRVRGRPHAAP